ncbi:MAG: Calx-beta domain-containing protein, partial [Isosphaeraceae bacterium]
MFRVTRSRAATNRLRPGRRQRALACSFDSMEDRVLLSQTPTGLPTFSTTAQVGGTYDTNSYMGVTQAGFYSSNEYSAWGFLQYGSSSAIFGTDAGVSAVSSVSLSLYNSATSGNYAPVAGDFSVYVLPSSESTNATAFQSGVQYQNTSSGITSSLYGSPALGSGSYTSGPTSLGLPGTTDAANAPYLVGTWNATTFQTGYLTYTSTATTTNSPTGTTAVSAGFGSQVASTIATDLNNDLPIQLCVVAASSGFQEDWEGNYSGGDQPELSAAYTQVPRVSLSSPTYSVNETDQVAGHVTPLTFSVTDTPNPASTTSVIDWTATSTNIAAGNFSPTSGKLTFTNNASPQTGTIDFSNIVAAENSGQVTITLSVDHTDTAGTIIGPIGTATGTINYIQGTDVSISPSSDSVNESAGTVTLTVTRSGSTTGTTATTVHYATANGTPYLSSNQAEQNALAGRDYTATSGTLSWAAGNTTPQTITVPLIDVNTFAGTRYFTVTLSNPSTGTAILPNAQSTITITDNTVTGSTVTGPATPDASTLPTGFYGSAGVETTGPYYTDTFTALVSTPHGSFGYSTMPVFNFDTASGVFPADPSTASVDSLRLSIYNTATTGGYAGTPGSFDVYLLTDNSVTDDSLRYQGGTGATGPVVIGTQATPVLLGSATFTNNYVGYNDFTFDLPSGSAAQNAVNAAVQGDYDIRFAITPSSGSPVAVDWEGDYYDDQPELQLLTVASNLPSWVTSPSGGATWNSATHTLTVTGAATIIADPGSDSPNIVASGAAAVLTIQPTKVGLVNLGGITLTSGASIIVPSVGASRTHTNHNVIVLDSNGTTVPTFSIDSSSKLDLGDNDMIIQNGGSELAKVEGLAQTGADYPNNDWTGNGLTSSTAKSNDANQGYEQTLLGVALNSSLPSGPYTSWQAGTSTLAL